jgi:hypothetical protein
MSMRAIVYAGVAAAGLVAVAARADSPALNVKTGLWEMTLHVTGLTIPEEQLARLPPEQRAKVQAMLGEAAQAHTVKTCLTQEKLARGVFGPDASHPECKRSVTGNTGNAFDMQVECTLADGAVSSTMHVEAPDPQTMKGKTVMTRANQPPMTSTVDGRWLAADCGDTK